MRERESGGAGHRSEARAQGVGLDELVEATSSLDPGSAARAVLPAVAGLIGDALLVGECVDATHPTLRGRVRVRVEDTTGEVTEGWLPTLYRLPVRVADRVLVARPGNWDEAVVIGVLDGFARRPEMPLREGASLELATDECLRIRSEDGTDLVEVRQEEEGPVVRLLEPGVDVEVPGSFRVRADRIRLEARKGPVEVEATDDVIVRGEIIRLN